MEKRYVRLVLLAVCVHAVLAQIGHECSSKIFTDLVTPLNYPVEEHAVVTSDGYILRVFRLQAKGSKIQPSGKPVVVLQHGNEDCSDDWVLNDEDKAPGFFLANQGFDVWLPNNRGNKYSMSNTRLNRYQKQFWDFSFQEMGSKDQPAIIEYILRSTGQQKVVYVGHSQGTTQMFAGLSDPASRDYLNSRISKFVALAPVVFATQCNNKALKQFADNPLILDTCNLYGQYQLFPAGCSMDSAQAAFMEYLCTIANWMCVQFLSGGDLDPVYDNTKRLPIFFAHSPNGASVRCFQHFAQMFYEPKSDPQFRMFDFGRSENLRRYGQLAPPVYDFRSIQVPVTLFTGLQDTLGDPGDNAILFEKLQAAGVSTRIFRYNSWGHLTFVWGLNVQQFFRDLLSELQAAKAESRA